MFEAIFNEAAKAALYLLAAFFILTSYRIGQRGLGEERKQVFGNSEWIYKKETRNEVLRRVLGGISIILITAAVYSFCIYGSAICNEDGDCDSGFKVTTEQRVANMTFWSVLFGVPYIAGGSGAYSKARGQASKVS